MIHLYSQVLFCGSLSMLELCWNMNDMKNIDLPYMPWCSQALRTTGHVSMILGQLVIRVNSMFCRLGTHQAGWRH